MAQPGNFTPLLIYGSSTPTNVPLAANLTNSADGSEIAINVADKNLFFKDSSNIVNSVPIRQSSASSNGWLSSTDWSTFNGKAPAVTYTTNYIPYGQGTTTPNQSAGLQFDGTNFTTTGYATATSFRPSSSTVPSNGLYLPATNTIGWSTNSTERVRIEAGGNFLLNTTDNTLYNNTSGNGLCYRINASLDIATNADNCSILNRMGSDGGIQEFRRSGTVVGSVSVTTVATLYNTTSDYRLKESVAPMANALSTIKQLKPVTYKWKSNGSTGQGFIAHELQAIAPHCVTGEKDAVDKEGKPIYQGIDTSSLIATLVSAIQELSNKFDAYVASHP